MNIDPLQILQVSIYSKIINGVTTDPRQIILLALAFFIYKMIDIEYCKKKILERIHFTSQSECSITIPFHRRTLITNNYGTPKENIHISYSARFHALNYYLSKHAPENIYQMVEIMKREYKNSYHDSEVIDYILLPVQNQKIEICKEQNIQFEIIVEQDNRDEEDGKKEKKKQQNVNAKNYVYRISKKGKENYHILKEFLEKCVKEFEDETINRKQQQTFEFMKSEKDEDDKTRLSFREYPFKSNKHLDKNIFFENKQDFIQYIDKFRHRELEKNISETEYEDSGITFKAGILLHGKPGCGKSATIRGILNRTGRHGVLVRWSLLKTCADFTGIFRSAINNTKYDLKDLCFIFEDFDANKDEVLKKRTDVITDLDFVELSEDNTNQIDHSDPTIENILKITNDQQIKNMHNVLQSMTKNRGDELTLECVLNTIDGIIELHNAMYIFTTNMDISKIDSAFIRPGRIDYILELKLATVTVIREMIYYKYRSANIDFKKYENLFLKMKDEKISPAEVQKIYMRYGKGQIKECLQELVKATNGKK
uniref:AAA+ ATPase domain-containing protein n=1 Tax=viral metagenome TaxID=1070528 RepID=A0A6C0JIF9_9ZZZZ